MYSDRRNAALSSLSLHGLRKNVFATLLVRAGNGGDVRGQGCPRRSSPAQIRRQREPARANESLGGGIIGATSAKVLRKLDRHVLSLSLSLGITCYESDGGRCCVRRRRPSLDVYAGT